MEAKTHPFVEYLEEHCDDRGMLAALRRGLGQPPGTVADMYRYVVPWLPKDVPPGREAVYYLVAALFAYHPAAGGTGNMGRHFADARDPRGDDTAIERRFTALLAAHPDDLDVYLRQAVSFLRSRQPPVPVNWHRLFYDLQCWHFESRSVQRDWARAFWGRPAQETPPTPTTEKEEE